MELLPRHERFIKAQVRSYNRIHNSKFTSRQWLDILIDLGQYEVDKLQRHLATGLIVTRDNKNG